MLNQGYALKFTQYFLQWLCFILLCYIKTAHADNLPTSQANYKIKYDGITIGQSLVTLQSLQTKHYLLSISDQPSLPFLSGNVLESSAGLWLGARAVPLQYYYNYRYLTKKRQIILYFNWRKKNVIIRVNGMPWTMPIMQGTQDKLSYELQLRQDLLNNKKSFSYPVADGGKIKYYQFKLIGNEIITTPLGTFNTIKIIRLPTPDKESVTLWIAKQLNYQIVQIDQNKNFMDHGVAEIVSYKQL